MKYYIIASEFNSFITDKMTEECVRAFSEQGIEPIVIRVPGALEIPLVIAKLLEKPENVNSFVAIGCLIKGETDHYKAICEMVADGVNELLLSHKKPIIFEVLMVDSIKKAEDRIEKAYHAGYTAVKMHQLMQEL